MKFKKSIFDISELTLKDSDKVKLILQVHEDGGLVLQAGNGSMFAIDNKQARKMTEVLLKQLEKFK